MYVQYIEAIHKLDLLVFYILYMCNCNFVWKLFVIAPLQLSPVRPATKVTRSLLSASYECRCTQPLGSETACSAKQPSVFILLFWRNYFHTAMQLVRRSFCACICICYIRKWRKRSTRKLVVQIVQNKVEKLDRVAKKVAKKTKKWSIASAAWCEWVSEVKCQPQTRIWEMALARCKIIS